MGGIEMKLPKLAALAATMFVAASGAAHAADPPAIPVPIQGGPIQGGPVQGGAPERTEMLLGELRVRNVSQPSLTPFLPAPGKATGAAVIVAPGGGFMMLSWDSEGVAVAKRLAAAGVMAFVLKYRLDPTPDDTAAFTRQFMATMASVKGGGGATTLPSFAAEVPAEADAAQAMRLVRSRAAEWGIDPHRVGLVGFSAGGITASNVATGAPSGRPDFVGIIYGALRRPVPADAPPAFIATAADDPLLKNAAVPMFDAWRAAGRPAELHLYEKGGHGFGMVAKGSSSDHWFDEFVWWMQARGLMGGKTAKPAP
jgi:acetyl esterase/lipase